MAAGGESFYMTDNYVGTRRGRSRGADFGFEMFPDKYEATNLEEDPNQIEDSWRNTLMDLSPEAPTFAYEEPRRNTYSRDFINLRDGGARVNTLPAKNEDFDTQFHDKDPRGWSTEQPWDEYRRVMANKMSNIDFKDDGDYSVPSQGIHPNTMYKNIKGAFYWVKNRMKWFSTSKNAWHNGGTGKFKFHNPKAVGFTDIEDTSSMVDLRYQEAEGRSHKTTQLSNIVHTGSKFLRANTTTDHEVKVAGYGQLYKQRGLINHETQLRLAANDIQLSKVEGLQATPTNVVALMASGARSGSAAERIRHNLQEAFGDASKYMSVTEQSVSNRDRKLTNDVMSLLGFTPMEIKWVDGYRNVNKKHADLMQAQLIEMVELVHAMPAHMKLAMRDELLMSSMGKGLSPADPTQIRRARDNSIINPKVVQYMDLMVRSGAKPGNVEVARRMGWADPENKLDGIFANGQLFTTRGRYVGESDNIANRQMADTEDEMLPGKRECKSANYAALARNTADFQNNRVMGINMQELQDTVARMLGKNRRMGDTRGQMVGDTDHDNDFGENQYMTRHGGIIGSKYMRRHMEANDVGEWEEDGMHEHGSMTRSGGHGFENAMA